MKKYLVNVSVFSAFTIEVEAFDAADAEGKALEASFEDFLRFEDFDLEVTDVDEI